MHRRFSVRQQHASSAGGDLGLQIWLESDAYDDVVSVTAY